MNESIKRTVVSLPEGEARVKFRKEIKEKLRKLIQEDYVEEIKKTGGYIEFLLSNEASQKDMIVEFTFQDIPEPLLIRILFCAEDLLPGKPMF